MAERFVTRTWTGTRSNPLVSFLSKKLSYVVAAADFLFLVKSELFNPSSAAAIFVNSPACGLRDEKAPARVREPLTLDAAKCHSFSRAYDNFRPWFVNGVVCPSLLPSPFIFFFILFLSLHPRTPRAPLPPINLRAGWVGGWVEGLIHFLLAESRQIVWFRQGKPLGEL